MDSLVYPRERTLGTITLVLGLLFWVVLIVFTVGVALLGLALGFLFYVFAQSALIAHIRGNGVELSETQFPDLHAQFIDCCERLQIKTRPQAYVLSGNGVLNAFATKFLGAQYVVLYSDVVDAMARQPDGVRFYLGHELGHLRMKHLTGALFRWPALWLPLLGAAYSRARESTCDRHGAACCTEPENAALSLAALAAGAKRWQVLDIQEYVRQTRHASGFWMSFHELTAAYPWLTKRAARVLNPDAKLPQRNALSYVLAVFVPYTGRLGSGFGLIMMVYIIGVLAAVAVPAYKDYTDRAKVAEAIAASEGARQALGNYYVSPKRSASEPMSLQAAGVSDELPDGNSLYLDSRYMILTLYTPQGELIFKPSMGSNGKVTWACSGGEKTRRAVLPSSCQ